MRGLIAIPAISDLERAYAELQSVGGAQHLPDERKLTLYSQWARFDPRLAEQLCEFFVRYWQEISPLRLNAALRVVAWPTAIGVILEEIHTHGDFADQNRSLFRAWADLVMHGFPRDREQGQLYFIGTRALGGKLALRDAQYSARSYEQWGYLGGEMLFPKRRGRRPGERTRYSAATRRAILDRLIAQSSAHGRIRVGDYLSALDGHVSRRQAELDLDSHPRLVARGRTKAREYRVR